MSRRLLSVFAFALVVSGLASVLVYNLLLSHVAQASTGKKPKSRLLVAAHDLEIGALLADGDLRFIETSEAIPPQVITDRAKALNRGVIAVIYEGEPIKESRLASSGAGAGLAAMIPVGQRAVAIRVDEVVGLAGFVVPGMRVDVIVSGGGNLGEQSRAGTLSRTILQNIQVLSAGQKFERRADGRPEQAQVVNLLVSPAQAETLSLASSQARIQLVLRNPLDTKEEKTPGTSVAALFGMPITPAPATFSPPPTFAAVASPIPRPQREAETVEVFTGNRRGEQKLDQ